jgi:hypothetical protein
MAIAINFKKQRFAIGYCLIDIKIFLVVVSGFYNTFVTKYINLKYQLWQAKSSN